MFEYDNGVLVCKEHRTPAQKDDQELWCRKCQKVENDKHDPNTSQ